MLLGELLAARFFAFVERVELLVGLMKTQVHLAPARFALEPFGQLRRVLAEAKVQITDGELVPEVGRQALVEGGLAGDVDGGVNRLVQDGVGELGQRVGSVLDHGREHRIVEPAER